MVKYSEPKIQVTGGDCLTSVFCASLYRGTLCLFAAGVFKGYIVTAGTPALFLSASRMHIQIPLGPYSAYVS